MSNKNRTNDRLDYTENPKSERVVIIENKDASSKPAPPAPAPLGKK